MQTLNPRNRVLWAEQDSARKPIISRNRKGRFGKKASDRFDNKGDLSVASSFASIEQELKLAKIYDQKR
ncbi:hypothetical protein [Kiloniella litopenaei]|uniref:hypothetical protein n=1 Tax=Kiloniella litopenaei TaxID=1549748 RepID=UPI003BA98F47